ncbi:MAG: [Fe-Fe] hydrogenase large subunit C-terminal domain-containing protein [Candidatus Zixiibacteriota bacterium]|jgi:Na+-translocating ferredoxin:NAD+ oxidoreductase RNF subunit RnfB
MQEQKTDPKKGYYHSVRLAEDRCIGCIHCVRVCPTEAIRVHFGKARINPLRCVDCGECIRLCPTNAKYAQTDTLDILDKFKYKVAIPASAFSGQFKTLIPLDKVFSALIGLGFDEVYEGALGGEIVTLAVREFLKDNKRPRPAISSLCPAVVRLVQVRFPALVGHIIPIEAPMDAAARVVKISRSRYLGIPPEEIGAFFISPCPAKVTAIKQPVAVRDNFLDGAFAISDIYNLVMSRLEQVEVIPGIARASGLGIGWGASGGENRLLGQGRRLTVDGVGNVVRVLELIESDEYHHGYDYLEMRACIGGCVGGPLTTQEPFVAKNRIDELCKLQGDNFGIEAGLPQDLPFDEIMEMVKAEAFHLKGPVEPRSSLGLGTNISETISRMKELEEVLASLPGIDCGSCGAPTCRAFAEDVVLHKAKLTDCTFKLRERLQRLANEMSSLSEELPPTLKTRDNRSNKNETDESS